VDNVQLLVESLEKVFKGMGRPFELIIVDDGSDDGTAQLLEKLRSNHPALKPIYHRRNYGQSAALTAGFDAATGEYVVMLDGDLQNNPADIPAMIEKIEKENMDAVCGIRVDRKDKAATVKIPSLIGNFFIRNMTGVRMHDYGCSLRVLRAEFAKSLTIYGELHRFIPVLLSQQGARLAEMPVDHKARAAGKSKYNLGKAPRVFLDLLLMSFFQKFATRPLQFFGGWGLLGTAIGGLMLFDLLVEKFMGHQVGHRPMLVIGALLIMVGAMLISIGLCAELIIRTYYESTGKKIYTTKEKP
jgi:glycosyltransferase involved in cell wall biosynthesis